MVAVTIASIMTSFTERQVS